MPSAPRDLPPTTPLPGPNDRAHIAQQPTRPHISKVWMGAAIIGLLSGSIGAQLVVNQAIRKTEEGGVSITQPVKVTNEQSAVTEAVSKVSPSVVSVIITKDLPKVSSISPFGFFSLNGQTQTQEIGGGSGFIVSSDGLIVTNRHVVADDQAQYTVLMNDGTKIEAKVVAIDPSQDIALFKIEKNDLPTVEFADSSMLSIGQTTIAIGNALGQFANTVSVGVVSGLGRSVQAGVQNGSSEMLDNVIQTDAAINPGNSGGPLLDIEGNVIGMNSAIVQGAQSVGFAIPSQEIQYVLSSYKEHGKILRPALGVRFIPITKAFQQANSLSVDYGALISAGGAAGQLAILPGGPADKAGLVENDIILKVGEIPVDAAHPLTSLIRQYKIGDRISLTILHKGKETVVNVDLEAITPTNQ